MPATAKKDEANYADSTIRSAQHKKLDEVYSKLDPELALTVVNSVANKKGETEELKIECVDGAYEVAGVQLDRDGWLRLAKTASRIAQAI